jgi:hypothetical protein
MKGELWTPDKSQTLNGIELFDHTGTKSWQEKPSSIFGRRNTTIAKLAT